MPWERWICYAAAVGLVIQGLRQLIFKRRTRRNRVARYFEMSERLTFFSYLGVSSEVLHTLCVDFVTLRAAQTLTDHYRGRAAEYRLRRRGPNHWEWMETQASAERNGEADALAPKWERMRALEGELEARYLTFFRQYDPSVSTEAPPDLSETDYRVFFALRHHFCPPAPRVTTAFPKERETEDSSWGDIAKKRRQEIVDGTPGRGWFA